MVFFKGLWHCPKSLSVEIEYSQLWKRHSLAVSLCLVIYPNRPSPHWPGWRVSELLLSFLGCSYFKGIVHPKMKICWKWTYPQAIKDVDVFLHWNRFGKNVHYITCSPMDHLQWMGAVWMRVQTAVIIIHK